MEEVWRDVDGYEGYYQVSNTGRVKGLQRIDSNEHARPERILALQKRSNHYGIDYYVVNLSKEGTTKTHLVHRLVAAAFVSGRTEDHNVVNHIDCNGLNNHAANLEWTSYKGNMEWAAKLNRMKANPSNLKRAAESRKVPVIAIDRDGVRYYYSSQSDAAKSLGVQRGHIAAACRNEYGYKTVGGYAWEYADESLQKSAKPKKIAKSKEERSSDLRLRMKGNKYSAGRKPSQKCIQASKDRLSKAVLQMDDRGNIINEFFSASDAQRKTGVRHIYECANGKRRKAGGYVWRWKEAV